MTSSAIKSTIRQEFKARIATPLSLPTVHDNQASGPPTPSGRWCRMTVVGVGTRQASIREPGARRYRTDGVVIVNLFEPLAAGDGGLDAIADRIATEFRGLRVTTPAAVSFFSPQTIGASVRDEAWWRRTIQIPFYADEIG